MNAIPCMTWVRRGAAKSVPERVKLDEEELRKVIEETRDQIDIIDDEENEDQPQENINRGAQGSSRKAGKRKLDEEEDIVDKYGLDDYDEEEEEPDLLKGIGNLTYHTSNDDDPYVTLKDDDSDNDDFEIKATDNLIVAGKAEKESCTLEVYVYNEDYGNLFVHHDILLSSFPLAVEWLNYDIGEDKPGNFVAVGTMEPVIEIWDLDLVDSLEPVATLGTKRKTKKKNMKKKGGAVGHTDAVLDLSWNTNVRNVIASASADYTVALWDLSEGKIVTSIKQHKEKVQCVKWHPYEQQSLISGSFDHTVKVYDCRNPNEDYKSWNLDGEVEKVIWDAYSPLNFFATTEKGHVYYLDSRQDKPVFTLSAHNQAVTGISQSSKIPGMFVTTSSDKTMKIWDVQDNKPSLVLERNLKINELFCVGACPEAPFVFAFGGERELKVWDIRESAAVRKHFKSRAPQGVTMEGDGDVTEDIAAEGLSGLSIDPEEQEDIDTLFNDDDNPILSSGATKNDNSVQPSGATKKKKKKKKKKKPTSD